MYNGSSYSHKPGYFFLSISIRKHIIIRTIAINIFPYNNFRCHDRNWLHKTMKYKEFNTVCRHICLAGYRIVLAVSILYLQYLKY